MNIEMIKKLIKTINLTICSIALFSLLLSGLTSYSLLTQSPRSNEINKIIKKIYVAQKTVIIDIINLSQIIIEDNGERIANYKDNDNIELETDLIKDIKANSSLDDSSINEDNGENPLGIIIEPSLEFEE